jgi:hypothetical protein
LLRRSLQRCKSAFFDFRDSLISQPPIQYFQRSKFSFQPLIIAWPSVREIFCTVVPILRAFIDTADRSQLIALSQTSSSIVNGKHFVQVPPGVRRALVSMFSGNGSDNYRDFGMKYQEATGGDIFNEESFPAPQIGDSQPLNAMYANDESSRKPVNVPKKNKTSIDLIIAQPDDADTDDLFEDIEEFI